MISNTSVTLDGEEHRFLLNAVGPDFLATTGMRLISGRVPSALDHPGSPPVAAVNETARCGPGSPVPEIRSQIAQMEETIAQERVFTRLLVVFGTFALLLASIGLHGVTAYSVARRTSEIGVRIAVGARPGQVLRLLLRQVFVLACAGLAIGVPLAIAAGPLVGSLLYGVAPNDVLVIGTAATVMLGVALAAGFGPARRAARLDPLIALAAE